MDLRIVHTCNSDCLYCLEQDLRKQEPFISYEDICDMLGQETQREVLCFYGGNPLLHPDLVKIITFAVSIGYKNISLLSNGMGLTLELLHTLKQAGLSGFSIYIHSLDETVHTRVSRSKQELQSLLEKLTFLSQSGLYIRSIIHTHALNIGDISQIIYVLYRKYGIRDFECINYNPVSRAQDFKNILGYDVKDYTGELYKLRKVIEKNNLRIQFKGFESSKLLVDAR